MAGTAWTEYSITHETQITCFYLQHSNGFYYYCNCHIAWQCVCDSGSVADLGLYCRGYVALGVATEKESFTKEVETGLGGDREGNMVAFAFEGLKLLRDVIKGNAKL